MDMRIKDMSGRRFRLPVIAAMALLFVASSAWGQVSPQSYFIWNTYGGEIYHDAEKFPDTGLNANTDDDLMCWAATASNILDWGDWDAPGLTGAQDMFYHFQAHWTDYGSFPDRAWRWWFDGTLPTDPTTAPNIWSSVDVPLNGGDFWDDEGPNFSTYYREMFASAGDLMPFIDDCLHDGYGVGIQIVSPDVSPWALNHEITLWGFDSHVDPSTGNTVYDAIHVTDSDDDQGNLNPLLVDYPITWDATNSHWDLGGTYSTWHIESAMALKYAPTTYWQYAFRYDYSDGGDYYYGYLYAPGRAGYYVDQVIEHVDESGNQGKYTILSAMKGDYGQEAANNLVSVTAYYDKESNLSFGSDQMINEYTTGGIGLGGLGTEHGYINSEFEDFFFGYQSGSGDMLCEADPLVEYQYVYDYEDGTGDWYTGNTWVHYYDISNIDSVSNISFHDEHDNPGNYDGFTLLGFSWDADQLAQVTVTAYKNHENDNMYTPVSVDGSEFFGHYGLGTERGYILPTALDTYFFGCKSDSSYYLDPLHYEADLLAIYSFKMTNSIAGDIYRGTVTADEGDYEAGMTIPLGEYGNLGSYEIISQDGYTNDASRYGQVMVTEYYDGQSQTLFGRNQLLFGQVGTYLKSEYGRLLLMDTPTYQFGWIDGELQQADPYWRYDFTCSYENGAGDSYTGTFYDHQLYEVGDQVYAFTDEHGLPGHYVITAVEAVDAGMDGRVYVNSYADKESGKTYTAGDLSHPLLAALPAGTQFPGSEAGYIIKEGEPDFFFGRGENDDFYEADLAARYDYQFSYNDGKGDFYTGVVYASQEYGYFVGQTFSTNDMDEKKQHSSYRITRVTYLEDTSQCGQVTVDSYYDREMRRTYVPTFSWGINYLGSEYGYINITDYPEKYHPAYSFPPGINKFLFGLGYYEADVKADAKK
jgi:hypothetical protein